MIACAANATEIPPGTVSGDWYASGNPYNVNGEIIIRSGTTLNIHEDVEVIFQGHYKFIVNGWLEAVGTINDSILFTAADITEGWHGIRFLSAPDFSRLEYCHLTLGSATGSGGAIHCLSSSPIISNSTISGNTASWGGGIYCYSSSPIISGNLICENSAILYDGGGIYCYNSSPSITGNTISGNTANSWYGGGIYCWDSTPCISGNIIRENSASSGGGIGCTSSGGSISGNTISGNSATWGATGGGIYCESGPYPIISGNTLTGNSASVCGGIYYYGAPSTGIVNCILWGDTPLEVWWYISPPPITYSDIQGMDFGLTNIMSDPLFIDTTQHDYRLQWGSPCIDAGDPASPLDPDGTCCDMGAWFYDQSMAVRVLLTPHDAPIEIPAGGSSFDYTLWATNIDPASQEVEIWCDVTAPNGHISHPLLGPVAFNLGNEVIINRDRTQVIPGGAPVGTYSYNGYAVAQGDTSTDSFTFVKLGIGGMDGFVGWLNTGESFDEIGAGPTLALPLTYALYGAYPNPFNPNTAISYRLSALSRVNLSVYDIAGKKVAELVNGWREAGYHEVTFDGSGLASGMYFYRIEAGDFSAVRKMVLMK